MNIIWKVIKVYVSPNREQFANYILAVDWQCTVSEGQDSVVETGLCNLVGDSSPFTPYENLTENQILSWVWNSGVNKEQVENNVATSLRNLMNPPIINPPLPWAS